MNSNTPLDTKTRHPLNIAKLIIGGLALLFNIYLVKTLRRYPILQAFKGLESSNAWLKTTILDFYLETIAFAMIVLSSESRMKGIIWVALNCILGSPVAIVYLLTKSSWKLVQS